jgi:hypothetical protein
MEKNYNNIKRKLLILWVNGQKRVIVVLKLLVLKTLYIHVYSYSLFLTFSTILFKKKEKQ